MEGCSTEHRAQSTEHKANAAVVKQGAEASTLSTNADGAYSPSCDSEPAMEPSCWSGTASSVTSPKGGCPERRGTPPTMWPPLGARTPLAKPVETQKREAEEPSLPRRASWLEATATRLRRYSPRGDHRGRAACCKAVVVFLGPGPGDTGRGAVTLAPPQLLDPVRAKVRGSCSCGP